MDYPRYPHWLDMDAIRKHYAGSPFEALTDDELRVVAWAALRGASLQEALHEALITAPHD